MSFLPSDIVLITGGNGHVAQHVIDQLLALPSGPQLRATVRSAASASQLTSHFSHAIASNRLTILQVPDLITPGAFDTAMKDVTHLAHIASPLTISVQDTEKDLLIPAIHGTTNILTAALTIPTLKSVVVTGSFASVMDPALGYRPGYTYTTADWNPITYTTVSDPSLDLTQWPEQYRPFITYMASKTLAERALWEFVEREKPRWRVVVVLPTYIGGPYVVPLRKGSGAEGLSWSDGLIWGVAVGRELPRCDFPEWVDVRDVARAHVGALTLDRGEGRGRRVIVSGGGLWYSDIADIVRRNFPNLNPSTEKQDIPVFTVDTSEARSLGIDKWIPMEKTVVDTVQQVLESQKA
ncbi:aldehyde reductase II [Lepidopterella palustris CBS 459.81]|uniref:Aldehyde reductase II n=1 Tax=Lepidopterella palustris CBS 459.81 TaxID=1314670 RepID=A0A8E2JEX2_9PEZI|nr:aldehyde reductase II [Lepidopterella palustris CBS 459.81]